MIRIILLTALLLVCESTYAVRVSYPACRRFVEERSATNTTPQDERVFVLANGFPSIVRFHKGITLREVIEQTSFKGKTAWVSILRADHPFLDYQDELKPLDVIVISNTEHIIDT
jgi:hypothetical protein